MSFIVNAINDTSDIIFDAIDTATKNASSPSTCKTNINTKTTNIDINTKEAVTNFESDKSKAYIASQIETVSKNIASESGESLSKITPLVTNLTNSMSQAYIKTCNNTPVSLRSKSFHYIFSKIKIFSIFFRNTKL